MNGVQSDGGEPTLEDLLPIWLWMELMAVVRQEQLPFVLPPILRRKVLNPGLRALVTHNDLFYG